MILQVSNYSYSSDPWEHTLNEAFWRAVSNRLGPLHIVGRCDVQKRLTTTKDGITYTVFPEKGGQARFVVELALWLRTLPPPALYWVCDAAVSNLAVSRLARTQKIPYLVELQGNFFSETLDDSIKKRLANKLALYAARCSTAIRVCTGDHARRLAELGFPEDKVVVVPTRVDVDLFDPDRHLQSHSREALGLPSDRVLLVSVGSLVQRKGFKHAVEALAQLPENVMLVLAGDGPERDNLRALATNLSVADRLILLGRVPHDRIPQVMAAGDIFVFPSFNEGMPRVVNEAQAMRLPVVATSLDGIVEQVVQGYTGFLVPPGNTGAIVHALEPLVADGERRNRIGEAGRERVMNLFRFETIMEQWESLLRRMLSDRHGLS